MMPMKDYHSKEVDMTISFTIPGLPKGKARPRVTKKGISYTPEDTVLYENLVKLCYRQASKYYFGDMEQLEITVQAYFSIPKGTSKNKRLLMLNGEIRPTKKPDIDNILKIVADSLNGIAYKDDKQIVKATTYKYYSEIPKVDVEIKNG